MDPNKVGSLEAMQVRCDQLTSLECRVYTVVYTTAKKNDFASNHIF